MICSKKSLLTVDKSHSASQHLSLEKKPSSYKYLPSKISFVLNFLLMPITFVIVCLAGVLLQQWGVSSGDSHLQQFFKWDYAKTLFLGEKKTFLLAAILVAFVYLIIIAVINRFWIATPIVASILIFFSVAQRIKVRLRNEPVLPSDISMAGTNGNSLVGFITTGGKLLIMHSVLIVISLFVLCIFLHIILGYPRIITSSHRLTYIVSRLVFLFLPLILFVSFVMNLSTYNSWSYKVATAMGDSPALWETLTDANSNGPILSFLRYVNPNAMTKPSEYSEETMLQVADRYKKSAEQVNYQRTSTLTDNTVIMVLSESYSDPTRVPGIRINEDPMPNIRDLKAKTTSGLMLSSGYGGGTAGLEFQALSGLSTSLFNSSLVSPYQQLVPSMKWTPTFNQSWGNSSFAIHPFAGSMYLRNTNFKKFGFQHFWTEGGSEQVQHTAKIDRGPYISDNSTYAEVLQRLSVQPNKSQFVQVTTMQNHMLYYNWYDNNQFKASTTDGSVLSDDEKVQINTYAKGVSYTDSATKDFLDSLNKVQKPVTVVFYGDHLPGIYETASKNAENSQALHETDYFIWSNNASASAQTKLSAEESNYTSPNYLIAQAAQHTNSKVSPYLAFLTEMHTAIPAMEPAISAAEDWSSPDANSGQLYLDSNGNKIDTSKLSKEQKSLLKDYKLIQYDITVGKNYLKNLGFMDLPTSPAE